MKKFWSYISNLHVNEEMDKLEAVQAIITNRFTFILSIYFIIDATRDFIFNSTTSGVILFGIGIVLLLSFFFKNIRFNPYSILITCSVLSLIIFYYSSSNGFENGITYYYFPLLISPLLILDIKKSNYMAIIIYILVLTLFCISHTYYFKIFKPDITHNNIKYTRNIQIVSFFHVYILFALTGYFMINKLKKVSKLYQQAIRSEKLICDLKEKIISSQKTTIENVVNSALNNDPSFLFLFMQFYPYFYDSLKEVNSNITNDELRLCAFLKLGFTTKDIAESNNLTIRTVQTKKNRLRKSFNLSSNVDLYIWIDYFKS